MKLLAQEGQALRRGGAPENGPGGVAGENLRRREDHDRYQQQGQHAERDAAQDQAAEDASSEPAHAGLNGKHRGSGGPRRPPLPALPWVRCI